MAVASDMPSGSNCGLQSLCCLFFFEFWPSEMLPLNTCDMRYSCLSLFHDFSIREGSVEYLALEVWFAQSLLRFSTYELAMYVLRLLFTFTFFLVYHFFS